MLSVTLAGVLGYQKLTQPEIAPIVVNQPAVNQPVTTTSDETAGWKTYTNQQYGFEMKYPSMVLKLVEWNTSTSSSSGNSETVTMVSLSIKGSPIIAKNNQFVLVFSRDEIVHLNNELQGIDCDDKSTWVQAQFSNSSSSLPVEKVLTIGGYPAKYSERIEKPTPILAKALGFDYEKIIFICVDSNPDTSFFIQLISDKNESYYSGIFNQMLSTFKFIK